MSWATARFATYGAAGSFTHNDLNSIQDQIVRATGLLNTDLDTASVAVMLGLSTASSRRGLKVDSVGGTTVNDTFTIIGSCEVQNITMPANGLMFISYQSTWGGAGPGIPPITGSGEAAIFVDDGAGCGVGTCQAKVIDETATNQFKLHSLVKSFPNGDGYHRIGTVASGLASSPSNPIATDPIDMVSGTIVGSHLESSEGGWATIENLAAGLYSVSVRYRATPATGSSVTVVPAQRLEVITMGF